MLGIFAIFILGYGIFSKIIKGIWDTRTPIQGLKIQCDAATLSAEILFHILDQLSPNSGQKYCRMHSAILSTFNVLPFIIKIFFVYF